MRTDYAYGVPRFERLLARMREAGCAFVMVSGNQQRPSPSTPRLGRGRRRKPALGAAASP